MFIGLWGWWNERAQDRKIRQHGWAGVYVGDYHTAPTWAYTIGFDETLSQPELVIFDAPKDTASTLLWGAFLELKAGTLELEDGKIWPDWSVTPTVWRKCRRIGSPAKAG